MIRIESKFQLELSERTIEVALLFQDRSENEMLVWRVLAEGDCPAQNGLGFSSSSNLE